jgi:hypothetical protein
MREDPTPMEPAPRAVSTSTGIALTAIVGVALAAGLYHLGLLIAPLHEHNAQTFFAFETLALEDLARAWRSRVFSLWAAQGLAFLHPALPVLPGTAPGLPWTSIAIAQWLAFWGLVTGAIALAAQREHALFTIVGSYACVVFGYSVGPDLRIYPWDLPALAVFTGFVALVRSGCRPHWIVLAIWLGMPFKETAIVLSAFPLALALSNRERALWAGTALAGCLALKVGLDLATGNSAVGLTMATASFFDEGPLWWWNLRQIGQGVPLWVNGGTLLAFLLLPNTGRTLVTFKAIALAFGLGNLLFGVITEYRIWFELIPLGLYALEQSLLRPSAGALTDAGASR